MSHLPIFVQANRDTLDSPSVFAECVTPIYNLSVSKVCFDRLKLSLQCRQLHRLCEAMWLYFQEDCSHFDSSSAVCGTPSLVEAKYKPLHTN